MLERCARCREPLLTLNWSALKRCETCDGYVEPDGEWVERREGDIRYAEAMTRDAPKTVAELAAALRSPRETFAEDLRELCRRHRRTHLRAFERPVDGLTQATERGTGGGYREGPSTSKTRLTIEHGGTNLTWRHLLLGALGAVVALALFYAFPESRGLAKALLLGAGLLLAFFSVALGLMGGLVYLATRAWPQVDPPRVRSVELRDGDETLVIRTSDEKEHPVSKTATSVVIRKENDGDSTFYAAYLNGSGFRGRLLGSSHRAIVRAFVLRLEYLLDLDHHPAPVPNH